MIDTHSHINFEEYKADFDNFLNDLKANEIEKVIIPGVEPATFKEISDLTNIYEMLYGAIGVHPSEAKTYTLQTTEQIKEYLQNDKIIAIGEIGLDYYWETETKELHPRQRSPRRYF